MDYEKLRQDQINNNYSPVVEAIKYEDVKYLEWLIDHGADVNALDKDGMSALHWLFTCFDINTKLKKEMAELLVNAGADINIKNNDGLNPMEFIIATSDCTYQTQNLIEICQCQKKIKIFDPEYVNQAGSTYIQQLFDGRFFKQRQLEMMKVTEALIDAGVDILNKDEWNRTILDRVPTDLKTGSPKTKYEKLFRFLYEQIESKKMRLEDIKSKDDDFSDIGFY